MMSAVFYNFWPWAATAARRRSADCGGPVLRRCPGLPTFSPPRSHPSGSDAGLNTNIRMGLKVLPTQCRQGTFPHWPSSPSSQRGFSTWASTACLMLTGSPTPNVLKNFGKTVSLCDQGFKWDDSRSTWCSKVGKVILAILNKEKEHWCY